MNWNTLNSIESFKTNELVLIFKHSPRCIVSRIVLKRFEDNFGSIKDYDNPKFQMNFGPTGKA